VLQSQEKLLMAKRTNPVAWGLVVVLLAGVVLVACSLVWMVVRPFAHLEHVCTTMPPLQVFENVFGRPPPSGVSDIRAAGRIWLGGRDVYLRFQATDEAIQRLTRGSQRTVGDRETNECIQSTRMEDRLVGDHRWMRWKEWVHWDEVERIQKPECYSLLPYAPSTVPNITLIVDRSRHLIYVYLYDI
jgi:hypothetical protein